jgi:hypothetical protein
MIRKLALAALVLTMGSLFAQATDISGKWTGKFITPVGINNYIYNFQVSGNVLTGDTNSSDTGKSVVQNGKIDGNNLSFTEPSHYNGRAITVKYTGVIQGETIKLNRTFGEFPPDTFVIKRAK